MLARVLKNLLYFDSGRGAESITCAASVDLQIALSSYWVS
jgi:hypothetical protein